MYELKKNGKVFTSKSVGTGPSSYEKRIYRAAVSQRFRNIDLENILKNKQTRSIFCITRERLSRRVIHNLHGNIQGFQILMM